jgi:hypothetical protein
MDFLKSVLGLALLGVAYCAPHAVAQSADPHPPEIVPHRPNSHDAGAPTTGSTATLKFQITNHGGPVMSQPTPYLIWYGNWNQSNGSDTAAGQQIVRDFGSGSTAGHRQLRW